MVPLLSASLFQFLDILHADVRLDDMRSMRHVTLERRHYRHYRRNGMSIFVLLLYSG
jgi:hypothetical protein